MVLSKLGWAALGTVLVGGFIVQSVVNPVETTVPQSRLPYGDAASVLRGENLYADNCASCHGANLEGAPNWKQRDADGLMPAPPDGGTGHTWHHPDQMLFEITKLGTEAVVGQGYQSNMPGFGGSLSDQEILDVLRYIKSTWPKHIIAMHNDRAAQSN